MKKLLWAASAVAALSCADIATASAQTLYDYPWCAAYSSRTKNCGFVTFEQCLATISGIGGFCERNPFYRPRPAKKRVRHS
jgi:hypothetical protein